MLKSHKLGPVRRALVGLASGDASARRWRTQARCRTADTDVVGGGPFELRPGEWTDDTAMALCLADSTPPLQTASTRTTCCGASADGCGIGDNSCTRPNASASATRPSSALRRLREDRNTISDLTDPEFAGNGSLMRLAPVAIYWHR